MSLIFQKPPFTYQYKVGVENLIDYGVTLATVNGPITGNLHLLVVPERVLVQDGQRLRFEIRGTVTGGAGTKVFRLDYQNAIVNLASFAVGDQGEYLGEITIARGDFGGINAEISSRVSMAGSSSVAAIERIVRIASPYSTTLARNCQFQVVLAGADTVTMTSSRVSVL